MEIKHIILMTDFLGLTRRAVDLSVHSGQAYLLTVYSALRLFLVVVLAIGLNSEAA